MSYFNNTTYGHTYQHSGVLGIPGPIGQPGYPGDIGILYKIGTILKEKKVPIGRSYKNEKSTHFYEVVNIPNFEFNANDYVVFNLTTKEREIFELSDIKYYNDVTLQYKLDLLLNNL